MATACYWPKREQGEERAGRREQAEESRPKREQAEERAGRRESRPKRAGRREQAEKSRPKREQAEESEQSPSDFDVDDAKGLLQVRLPQFNSITSALS